MGGANARSTSPRSPVRFQSVAIVTRHPSISGSTVKVVTIPVSWIVSVITRPGSGSFVAQDAPERLRTEPPNVLITHDASPFALLEARESFEPPITRLAATRARRDSFAERLLADMERLSDPTDPEQRAIWSESDRMFHRQIGAMTGNPVVVGLYEQIAEFMDQPLWRRLRDDSLSQPGRMQIHIAEHRMIYEAVVEGDLEASEMYARQHIRRVRRYMTLD